MSHVGVERFAPGHHQEHRSQDEEAVPAVVAEERDRVERVYRRKHSRVRSDRDDAQDREGREPQHHDRAEDRAHAGGAVALHQEEAHEDEDGKRKNIGLEERGRDRETFERAQDGDRRSDHAVAVQEGGAEDAHPEDGEMAGHAVFRVRPDQREEREDAAFAAVVGSHHEGEVLQGDDDEERPEDERENAVDVLGCRSDGVGTMEAFSKSVERARPDVAVDHSESAEREREKRDRLSIGRFGALRALRAL